MGETRVDLLHLLEDLRDAYPGGVEETILTEILANSLDSGATKISLMADSSQATLVVTDNGSGMQRRDLSRYHDIAASTKTRGQGIGFAGVGIKLGLLVSREVVTESRRGKSHVATSWHLASRYRAPWKWIPPPGMVAEQGTSVRLTLSNPLSPLLDPGFLEGSLGQHFHPLLDPTFDPLLSAHYGQSLVFTVNGVEVEKSSCPSKVKASLEIRLLRKRKPSAVGYLFREDLPLPQDQWGVAISTYGKVIKRGWDWLGLSPQFPDRIGGLIEAPGLSSCLTLNKGDFIRVGTRGATYLAYRKAIQEVVLRQLSMWGEARGTGEVLPPRQMRPMERDLERVLEDLADDFPLLGALIEKKKGGQKRLPLGGPGPVANVQAMVTAGLVPSLVEHEEETNGDSSENPSPTDGERKDLNRTEENPPISDSLVLSTQGGPKRPARLVLGIQFEDRPGDPELGRLMESTVWVNQAHPAYQRAVASRSVGYHIALAVGLALAPLAVEPAGEHSFVTMFLSRWGEVMVPARTRRSRKS